MPDDGKLKVKDTVPHVAKTSTNNVKTVPNPKTVVQPTPAPQGQGGVTTAQWTVMGLLILLLVLELVIHPTFQSKVIGFLSAFKPAPNSTPANTPTVISNEDIGNGKPATVDDIGTTAGTSNVPVGGTAVGSF